jgi:hypothetical protein
MTDYNPTNDPRVYVGTFSEDQIIQNDEGIAFYLDGKWIPVPTSMRTVIVHPDSFQMMIVVGEWLVPLEPLQDRLTALVEK